MVSLREAQQKGGKNSRKNLSTEAAHKLAVKAARASARARRKKALLKKKKDATKLHY